MPRYTVELVQHEEKDELYHLTVEAEDADSASQAIEEYIEAHRERDYPGGLVGRCPGVIECEYQEEESNDSYLAVRSVEPLPEEADPNQLALL